MSSHASTEPFPLPLDLARQVDDVCIRFEAAWTDASASDGGPIMEDYLADLTGRAGEVLFREIIRIDVFHRRRRGELPQAADYQKRFPNVSEEWLSHDLDVDTEYRNQAGDQSASTFSQFQNGASRALGDGLVVPGYEMLGELGRGGMGIVFKAWQKNLDRFVAFKMIKAGSLASPQALARFRVEALAAARLQHPHIVQIHEVGEFGGRPYLALEYVDGGSLALKLAGAPQPARPAAQFVALLAQAMHCAHERSIVHRDLKPANILLARSVPGPGIALGNSSEEGGYFQPKITDFGLAKLLSDEGAGQTGTGDFLGTPSYMAPEQASGHANKIGPAVDVYALGAILYEILTGRPPFRAETAMETILQTRLEEPIAPRRLRPNLPHDLETICLKCLQKEPQQRYPSAWALAEDLRLFLAEEPIRARPVGAVERVYRWCRRKPAMAALLGSVCALLLVLAVGAPLAALLLHQQRDEAQRNADDAIDKLWHSYQLEAESGALSRTVGQRFHGLDVLLQAAEIRVSLELRNQAITCMALADLRAAQMRENERFLGLDLDFDPKLERYASMEDQGDISIRGVADNRQFAHLRGPGNKPWYVYPLFSPNGRFLAVNYYISNGKNQCLVWDLLRGERVLQVPIHGQGAGLDFSPDSRWLANCHPGGAVGLYDLASEKPVRLLDSVDTGADQIAFRPNGRQIAITSATYKMVQIVDIESGKVSTTLPQPAGANPVAWRGDGRLLAVGCDDTRTYVWNTATWREQATLEGHDEGVNRLTFNHAGNALATKSWDGTTRLWDPVSGRQLVSAPGSLIRFSSDDRRLAFSLGARFGIWEVEDGQECRTLHHGDSGNRTASQGFTGPWAVDFSPDGRLLVSAGGDGARLWDVAAGREIAHLPVGAGEAALFHPEGASLITYSRAGLLHWPMQPSLETRDSVPVMRAHAGGGLTIGPPQVLADPVFAAGTYARAGWSADGRRLAFVDHLNSQGVILNNRNPAERVHLRGHPRIISIALSPDGRWAATGTWRGRGVKVWEAATGELVKDLPGSRPDMSSAYAAFSPDGQWLVIGGQSDYRFWRVGSWEAGPVFERDRIEQGPGPLAFSKEGRVLAIARSARLVQLIDPASLREIAQLQTPDPHPITWLSFNPDGSKLAVATASHVIQLWDLSSIRRQLAAMHLDWDLPPYETPLQDGAETLSIHVNQGDLGARLQAERLRHEGALHAQQAEVHYQAGRWKEAGAEYTKAVGLRPDDAATENSYAWLLATCPDPAIRDPRRAIELAKHAVERVPERGTYWNTLGAAYYRAADWKAAVAALEKSRQLRRGGDSFDWFFLAMANWKLGNQEPAHRWYDQAVEWMEKNQPNDEELGRFRAEAATLLGISTPPRLPITKR